MPTQDNQINVPKGVSKAAEKPKSKAEVTQKIIDHYDQKATQRVTSVSNSLQKLEQSIS